MTHERYEHGPLVEAWLKEPTFVPAADLALVSRAIARTPQRPEGHFRLPQVRFQAMLNATKAATAVAILGISGALLAMQLGTIGPNADQAPAAATETATSAPPTAEPTATESAAAALDVAGIVLPDELPDGLEEGTLDTPAGPARWVHLASSHTTVPGPGRVLPWAEGIAIWDAPGEPATLRATTDGVEWHEVQLPSEIDQEPDARLDYLDGITVVYSLDDDLAWTFADGGWQPVDTTALREARPKGWREGGGGVRFKLVDGRPVMIVRATYYLPRKQLGISRGSGDTERLFPLGGMRYAVCGEKSTCNANQAARVLRFKETADGLVVRDDRTGERLGLLKDAKAADLFQGRQGKFSQDFALEGDTLVPLGASRPSSREPEPAGPAPAPLPEGASYWGSGSYWGEGSAHLAFALRPSEGAPDNSVPADWWLYIGGGWADLTEFGIPDVRPYVPHVAAETFGDSTLIWFRDGERRDLWIVEAPAPA